MIKYIGSKRRLVPVLGELFEASGATTALVSSALLAQTTSPPNGAATTYSHNTVIGSLHEGGTHGLLADGSVRFLGENMDLSIVLRLGAKNDGEVIGEF